jgi:hypothetical protein
MWAGACPQRGPTQDSVLQGLACNAMSAGVSTQSLPGSPIDQYPDAFVAAVACVEAAMARSLVDPAVMNGLPACNQRSKPVASSMQMVTSVSCSCSACVFLPTAAAACDSYEELIGGT